MIEPSLLRRGLRGAALIASLLAPIAIWTFIKPVRVLVPQWNGVRCVSAEVCTDLDAHAETVLRLYESAYAFVADRVGPLSRKPRIIFCATEACFRAFGLRAAAGATIGLEASVMSPRGWTSYYVRHEMIHWAQKERLGRIHVWLFMPEWFTEGMAYALSDDPRPLLAEPLQSDRARFRAWYLLVGKERLWIEAGKL